MTHVEESNNLFNSIEVAINEHSIFSFNPQKFNETAEEKKEVPWHCGCLYSCELCLKQFFERVDIIIHIKTSHKVPIQKYEEKWNIGTLEDIHECEICGNGITWTKLNIQEHVLSQHELNIDQYYNEFKDYIDTPKLKIKDKTLFNTGEESENSSRWADKCVFQCDACDPLSLIHI